MKRTAPVVRTVRALLRALLLPLPFGCASPEPPAVPLGEPLPGLTPQELTRFREGEALFNHVFTVDEGLGPLFNENQCSACHTDPVSGGTGEQLILKATRFDAETGGCDLLRAEGGENVRQLATPLLRAHGVTREPFPASATERGRFSVTPLFGLGLIEAIPERTIVAGADPEDASGDGISGRVSRTEDGRLGRFARKQAVATIEEFVGTALLFEMGITNPLFPAEVGIHGRPLPPGVDPAADPEVDRRVLDRLTDYVRFLAAPSQRVPTDPTERRWMEEGQAQFGSLGCASCHVPRMRTGRSEVAALDRTWVYLYSDLLLHDLGPQHATVCGPTAAPSEYRTGILMGLGRRREFMHDGRAISIHDAILLHGGEAAAARARYQALDRVTREKVLQFLRSL